MRGSTRRAFITPDAPREWCRPLAKGVEPAYDWALRYIVRDARALQRELEGVRAELGELEAAGEGGGVRAGELREKVGVLEIQSEANLPDVRWKARNGMGEFLCLWFLGRRRFLWEGSVGRCVRGRFWRCASASRL